MDEKSHNTTNHVENTTLSSFNQMLTQMSLANVSIPKFTTGTNVFEFITEYELATITLSDEQRVKLLVRAFTPGDYRAWFETELEPLIVAGISWSTAKAKVLDRFSYANDTDNHFLALRDLRYDVRSGRPVIDFIDKMIYTYRKACPKDQGDDTVIRYIKTALPKEVLAHLQNDTNFREAKDLDSIKIAVRRFDASRDGLLVNHTKQQFNAADITEMFQKMLNTLKGDQEENRRVIVAAIHNE